MINVLKPVKVCADFAQDRAEDALWVGKMASGSVVVLTRAVVGITAEMCKEVGGLRSVAGAISAAVNALDLFGVPVAAFAGVVKACDSANKSFGGIHVVHRLNEFATGKAYSSAFYLVSRISFLVKDTLSFVQFIEGLALISAGTAKAHFAAFSQWSGIAITPQSISPTFEYFGWGLDAANNLANWHRDWQVRGWESLTLDRGFSLALDVTKLTAISLATSNATWLKAIRFAALFGTSAVHIGRATHRYLIGQAHRAPTNPSNPPSVPVDASAHQPPACEEGSNAGSHVK